MPFRQYFQRLLNVRFVFIRKPVLDSLKNLAKQQQRPPAAVAADLLSAAVNQQHSLEFQLRYWEALTPREQEVTALTCLGYRNADIGKRLNITKTTVSTHVRNICSKYGLRGKTDLRQFFAALDFSKWEEEEEEEEE